MITALGAWALLAATNVSAQPGVDATTHTDAADSSPGAIALVGHASVVATAQHADHIYSLGTEGLLVRWSLDSLQPERWVDVSGATWMTPSAGGLLVAFPEEIRVLNADTLSERASYAHTGALPCVGSRFAWSWHDGPDDVVVRLFTPNAVVVLQTETAPGSVARCSTSEDAAWVAWFDGGMARYHGFDGETWTSGAIPWDDDRDPQIVGGLRPHYVHFTANREPYPVSIDTGGAIGDIEARPDVWRACATYRPNGEPLPCTLVDAALGDRMLNAAPMSPIAVLIDPEGIVVVERHGWTRIHGTVPPHVERQGRVDQRVYGVTADARVIVCVDEPDGARFGAWDVAENRELDYHRVSAPCPSHGFMDATGFGVVVDGTAIVYERGFRAEPATDQIAVTPSLGRSRIGFALTRGFDAGCDGAAITLMRTRRGEVAEPVFGPQCETSARVVPLADALGEPIGVALVLNVANGARVLGIRYDGRTVTDAVHPEDVDAILRAVLADAASGDPVLEIVTSSHGATAQGDVSVLASHMTGSVRARAHGHELRLSTDETSITIQAMGRHLVVHDNGGVWFDTAAHHRLVVRLPDGRAEVSPRPDRWGQWREEVVADFIGAVPPPATAEPRRRPVVRWIRNIGRSDRGADDAVSDDAVSDDADENGATPDPPASP